MQTFLSPPAFAQRVCQLVSDNQMGQAIEELVQALKEQEQHLYHQVVLISSRYKKLLENTRKGTLSREEIRRERARISTHLLSFSDELRQLEGTLPFASAKKERNLMVGPNMLRPAPYLAALFMATAFMAFKWMGPGEEKRSFEAQVLLNGRQLGNFRVNCTALNLQLTTDEKGQFQFEIPGRLLKEQSEFHFQFSHPQVELEVQLTRPAKDLSNLAGGQLIFDLAMPDDLVEAEDNQGKKALIRLTVLSKSHFWTRGALTISQAEKEEAIMADSVFHHLFKPASTLASRINQAGEVICLGNASFETDADVPPPARLAAEEARAQARARALAQYINEHVLTQNHTQLYTCNLGKYLHLAPAASDDQRRIVILAVVEKEQGTVLEEVITDALLQKKAALPFDIEQFSKIKNGGLVLLPYN